MKQFVRLQKPKPGDQVGVISPSAGLPGLFPWVFELGLQRLKDDFGLKPKEYPTTRQIGSNLKDRAQDIMAAFSDPANKAVIASIGGEDQIKLLKYLDSQVLKDNPKPYFGYSDNTHLINYLWNLGIPAYYGGSIMTEYAMQLSMHDFTVEYLRKALFETGEVALTASEIYGDEGLDWKDKENLSKSRKMEPNEGWYWDGDKSAQGILWGGCLESMIAQFSVGKYLPAEEDLKDTILFIETAEDIPEAWLVEYALLGMGERGWFDLFSGVLVGRPKAWEFDKRKSTEEKADYKKEQRETILRVIREYNSDIPIVQNLDFGHTAPQHPIPSGSKARIDSSNKQIYVTY